MKNFKKLFFSYLLAFIIILVGSSKNFAQQYTQEFSHIGKVTFPSVPIYKALKSDTGYTYKDESNIYTFVIHSFRKDTTFSIDSGSNDLKKLYNGFVKELTDNSKITLVYKKHIIVDGLDAIAIKYIIDSPYPTSPYTCYHRILYVNRTMYNWGFATNNDSGQIILDKKDRFLNSFTITEKKQNLYQYYEVDNDNPIAKKLGELTAKLIIYGIVAAIAFYIIKGLKDLFF